MYLLDTNVVSELRKALSDKANKNVVCWVSSVATEDCFITANTVMELKLGILLLQHKSTEQASVLRYWFEKIVLPSFSGRILAFDVEAARICASYHVPAPRSERDAMIAAIATRHNMTVATRNVDDFHPTNVPVLNPWEYRHKAKIR